MASSPKSTASNRYVRLVLIVSGIIIFAPGIIGALSVSNLSNLYGVEMSTGTEAVLLQHRGILLAIIGGLLLVASIVCSLRLPAILIGLVSNITFVTLTTFYPNSHFNLAGVAWVDIALTLLLISALVIQIRNHKG